jgi:protocatechuate 3,4-dioxygenase beta subunit
MIGLCQEAMIVGLYRIRIFLVLAPLTLWCAARAQDSAAAVSKTATIEGIVTSLPSTEPLKSAHIELSRPGEYRALYRAISDGTGHFSIEAIEPGSYQVRVNKDGYSSPRRRCSAFAVHDEDVITLVPGQNLSGVRFQLFAPGAITGHVLDPSGDPVAEAEVDAYMVTVFHGHRKLAKVGQSTTDDRGQFRLFHLEPGKYFLRLDDDTQLRDQLEESTDAPGRIGFRPIFYPDTFDLDHSTSFLVHAGQEISGVDFTAHSTEVIRITGKVVNGLTNEPIETGNLAALRLDPGMPDDKQSIFSESQEGEFELSNLIPGRYLISSMTSNPADRKAWRGFQEIDLRESGLALSIRVFPSRDVSGRVEIQENDKIDFRKLQVELRPHSDVNYGMVFARVNPDGTFLIADVGQDIYEVEVTGLPSSYYLKTAFWGTVELVGGRLKIRDASDSQPLILKLGKPAAKVQGQVQTVDGEVACSAQVVLVPEGEWATDEGRFVETGTDQNGNYSFKDIVPGDYRLLAWDQNSPIAYSERGSLEQYESQGAVIHLKPEDHLTVPLKLIPVEGAKP